MQLSKTFLEDCHPFRARLKAYSTYPVSAVTSDLSIPIVFTPGSSAGMASYASCAAGHGIRTASTRIPPWICRYHLRLILALF